MASRPTDAKKRRRVAKTLRRSSLPTYFDLWQWLIDHGHAKSRREAKELILAERVKSESHTLGVSEQMVATSVLLGGVKMEKKKVADRYISTDYRKDMVVL